MFRHVHDLVCLLENPSVNSMISMHLRRPLNLVETIGGKSWAYAGQKKLPCGPRRANKPYHTISRSSMVLNYRTKYKWSLATPCGSPRILEIMSWENVKSWDSFAHDVVIPQLWGAERLDRANFVWCYRFVLHGTPCATWGWHGNGTCILKIFEACSIM